MIKKPKHEVDYSEGHADAHCGICRHFLSIDPEWLGDCELVSGSISPKMWCKLFAKERVMP